MSTSEDRIFFTAECPKCQNKSTSRFSKSDLEEALRKGQLSHYCTPCLLPFTEALDADLRDKISKMIKTKF